MRCDCCDKILNGFEATRKYKESGEYVNMCNSCTSWLPPEVKLVSRSDLQPYEQVEDSDQFMEFPDDEE